jgi:hypothetical protein
MMLEEDSKGDLTTTTEHSDHAIVDVWLEPWVVKNGLDQGIAVVVDGADACWNSDWPRQARNRI